jgi:hypothetical protein
MTAALAMDDPPLELEARGPIDVERGDADLPDGAVVSIQIGKGALVVRAPVPVLEDERRVRSVPGHHEGSQQR